jgi:hypothetical protein
MSQKQDSSKTDRKYIHIFGGGTRFDVAHHFKVEAEAKGTTAKALYKLCKAKFPNMGLAPHLTYQVDGGYKTLATNNDIQARVDMIKSRADSKIVFFSCALLDWIPDTLQLAGEKEMIKEFGKYTRRLETRENPHIHLSFAPANKVIQSIRNGRKDIFLVGFKTTVGKSNQEMFEAGLRLCKEASCNLVLVNDAARHWNMIVTPEEAAYHETANRDEVLANLVDMSFYRSQLTFTQSTVIASDLVPWDERIPAPLKAAVEHCIAGNAYKPFNGATVGHFAFKMSDTEFVTSIRKSDFNKLPEIGMVYVRTDGPDTVLAYGAKPSVGGQSQRMVFRDHPGYDCILHFHSPMRPDAPDKIPVRSQRNVECGSHQCGQNTSDGLETFEDDIKAVMLEQHGPNIVFKRTTAPDKLIKFVERNWDLSKKTGGYTLEVGAGT